MGQTLLIIDQDSADGERLAAPFRDRGWDVSTTAPDSGRTVELIAEARPLAAVFCLQCGDPSVIETLAADVLGDSRALRPLMVFVSDDPELVARVKTQIPVGVFVHEDELPWVLKHLAIKL